MKKSRLLGAVCAFVFTFLTMPSQAALIGVLPTTPGGNDYQAWYDDVADLTWLTDAIVGGLMTWQDAKDLGASLDIDGIAGPDGWRLPTSDNTCEGWNCTGSELGNLFYNVLGGVANRSIGDIHNIDYLVFYGIQDDKYWSSTDYAGNPTYDAYSFDFYWGWQDGLPKHSTAYAWFVQSGNAGVVPVPPRGLVVRQWSAGSCRDGEKENDSVRWPHGHHIHGGLRVAFFYVVKT